MAAPEPLHSRIQAARQHLRAKDRVQLLVDGMRQIIPRRLFSCGKVYLYASHKEYNYDPEDADIELPPELREATVEDAEAMGAFRMGADRVRRRLESGQQCSVLYRDGKVIATSWARRDYAVFTGWFRARLADDEQYTYDQEVARELRGQRIAGELRPVGKRRRARGRIRRSVWCIDASNHGSLTRLSRKKEREPDGELLFVRVLGLTVAILNGRLRVGHWTREKPLELPLDEVVRPPPDA